MSDQFGFDAHTLPGLWEVIAALVQKLGGKVTLTQDDCANLKGYSMGVNFDERRTPADPLKIDVRPQEGKHDS